MDDKNIAKALKNLRIKSGLTQDFMSEKLGICRATYNNLENGKTAIINGHIYEAAKLLKCSPEAIVGGYDSAGNAGENFYDVEKERNLLKERLAQAEEELRGQKEYVGILKEVLTYRQGEMEKLKSENELLVKENARLAEENRALLNKRPKAKDMGELNRETEIKEEKG